MTQINLTSSDDVLSWIIKRRPKTVILNIIASLMVSTLAVGVLTQDIIDTSSFYFRFTELLMIGFFIIIAIFFMAVAVNAFMDLHRKVEIILDLKHNKFSIDDIKGNVHEFDKGDIKLIFLLEIYKYQPDGSDIKGIELGLVFNDDTRVVFKLPSDINYVSQNGLMEDIAETINIKFLVGSTEYSGYDKSVLIIDNIDNIFVIKESQALKIEFPITKIQYFYNEICGDTSKKKQEIAYGFVSKDDVKTKLLSRPFKGYHNGIFKQISEKI